MGELVEALENEPEFFEDGLSADLAESGITKLTEAYREGYNDAREELRAALAHAKEQR